MRPLILASQSIYRRLLLEQAGFQVECRPTGLPEPDLCAFASLELGLLYLAQMKALAAADAVSVTNALTEAVDKSSRHDRLILGCDTVGVVAREILGKPNDRNDAERMLRLMSGRSHEVFTGWCLVRLRDRLVIASVERTEIDMRPWTDREVRDYLDSGEWQGKSGAYGLQWPADPFVNRIQGSAANVIGVPIERLCAVIGELDSGLRK